MEHRCFVCGKDIEGKPLSEFGVCNDCFFDLGDGWNTFRHLARSIHKEDPHRRLKEYLSNAVVYIISVPLLYFYPVWLHEWIASEVLCFILGLVLFVGTGVLLDLLFGRLKDAWDKTGSQAEESRVQAILKENETLYYAIKDCEDFTPYRELINQRSAQAQKEYEAKEKRKDIIIKIIAYGFVAVAIISYLIKK